jgi:hypothetical protein
MTLPGPKVIRHHYAARIIDGNDPIDLADSEDVPEEFNGALKAEITEYFGDEAPELIVAIAAQKTGYCKGETRIQIKFAGASANDKRLHQYYENKRQARA